VETRSVSVVIPVYRGAQTLPELLARLHPLLCARGQSFEIILVDDGSPDGSWNVITELTHRWPGVVGIALSRNYGQHNALLCGIRRAQHAIVVTMDDDLQHPPEEVPCLLDRLTGDVDVVYGTPQQETHGAWRDGASIFVKWALSNVMGAERAKHVGPFRAFRTQMRDGFANYSSTFVNIDVLLNWSTTRVAAVAVPHHPRRQGQSGYNFRKLVTHALNLLTGFSVTPLRMACLVGVGAALVGLCAMMYALVWTMINGTSVPGFLFLTSIITLFSGTQLFFLGILGEYLGRAYLRIMERPAYLVRQETSGDGGLEVSKCA
jgi:glycosyltransferase involved in cell wall biosynthesis